MFDSRLRHSFAMLETFRQKFSGLLFDTIVHTNVKLKESVVLGQTVAVYDKYSRGTKDYFTLSKEIICAEKKQLSIAEASASPPPVPAPAGRQPRPWRGQRRAKSILGEDGKFIKQEVKDVQQLFPVRLAMTPPPRRLLWGRKF